MDARALLKLGFQYFAQKDYEKACFYFNKALEIDDHFIPAYSALCEALNRMGEIEKALNVVNTWLSLASKDAKAHFALARLYVQKGLIEQAEKEMEIAKSLSPLEKSNK
ncbi:Tetratricopeptide TPR_2 repeat-containing protein [Caldithrix abyssi DSM 13497]|uniref:Tetratricopeptide TPR_2 repeat-containing protein n=1 Tax=Caldithrix abyssi DSM 13497 TaxID=880073 RepID=H1XXA5_CALAY|nr:tetratricopeptide repeat protein [Caldithrix abyssi]APF17823.1 Tetratricopeptide repeat-containing protein [Caldithrix abyssi DSM 13497]EHO41890.1 Tetratricopeptide TPR_2 repeat-containing protein [Caldithrix abyssi DSM 13497]